MKLEIDLPDELSQMANAEEWRHQLKLNTALSFYRQGRFTLSQAAQFANMDIYDWIALCGQHKLPIIDYDANDLSEELSTLKRLQE